MPGLCLPVLSLLTGLPSSAWAEAREPVSAGFDIPAQPLGSALQALALQSGRQIVFTPALVAGHRAPRVVADLRIEQALERLLAGSGLTFRIAGASRVILVMPRSGRAPALHPSAPLSIASLSPAQVLAARPIVVTRRSSDLSPNLLDDALVLPGQDDLGQVVGRMPGVSAQAGSGGQLAILVRGIGLVGDTTTAVYFGGVPISGPSGTGSSAAGTSSDLAMVDLASLTVSRHSRGTEHGVGTLAGEVIVEPAAPVLGRMAGEAQLGFGLQAGGAASYRGSWMENLPMGANTALRLVAYRQRDGGYVDNVRTGTDNINTDTRSGLRASLLVEPSTVLSVSALLAWQQRRIADTGTWVQSLGAYRTDRYFAAPTRHDLLLGRLLARATFGALQVQAISAFYQWNIDRTYDRSNITLAQAQDPQGCVRYFALGDAACSDAQMGDYTAYAEALAPSLLHIPIHSRRLYEEFSIGTTRGAGLSWVFGVAADWRRERLRSELSSVALPSLEPVTYFGVRRLAIARSQQAAFAHLDWRGSDGIELSMGVRGERFGLSSTNTVIVPNIISGSLDSWSRKVRVSHGWQGSLQGRVPLTGTLALHGELSRTDRPGGVNTAPAVLDEHIGYRGDSLWGMEAGLAWHQGREVDVEMDVFINDWRHVQYRAFSDNRSFAYLVNIGNASMAGVELAAAWRPNAAWRFSLSASSIQPCLTRVSDAASLVGGPVVGDRLPNIPRWRGALGLVRKVALASGVRLEVGAEWQFQSGFESTFRPDDPDRARTPARNVINSSAKIAFGVMELSISVKNLFNSYAISRIVSNGYGPGQTISSGPRQIFVAMSRSW